MVDLRTKLERYRGYAVGIRAMRCKNAAELNVVRKLLAITKPTAPLIIVYSNPKTLINRLDWLKRGVKRLFKFDNLPDSGKCGDQELGIRIF